jgi:hypothetical protein
LAIRQVLLAYSSAVLADQCCWLRFLQFFGGQSARALVNWRTRYHNTMMQSDTRINKIRFSCLSFVARIVLARFGLGVVRMRVRFGLQIGAVSDAEADAWGAARLDSEETSTPFAAICRPF